MPRRRGCFAFATTPFFFRLSVTIIQELHQFLFETHLQFSIRSQKSTEVRQIALAFISQHMKERKFTRTGSKENLDPQQVHLYHVRSSRGLLALNDVHFTLLSRTKPPFEYGWTVMFRLSHFAVIAIEQSRIGLQ